VALWDEVKDKLKKSALNFEGNNNGYVLPVLAIKPSILLMDEPTSALDPFHFKIEEPIYELKNKYTIVIVT
jgi:phosphate transport system ATP-binding protein